MLVPAVAAAVALAAGTAPAAGAEDAQAQDALPSVRLVAATPSVTLYRYGRGRVALDLGVFVASVGGDFELRVSRPAYGEPPVVAQIDPRTGEARPLPVALGQRWRGLRRFLEITVRNRAGDVVATRRAPFCPNSWVRQRVTDTGTAVTRYPSFCGSWFPFVRGMVWGIDDGWAVNAFAGEESEESRPQTLRLARGRYAVSIRVAAPYAELFGVSPEHAEVVLALTVRDRAGRPSHGRRAALHTHGVARGEAVPEVAEPDATTLPDLVALPAWSVGVNRGRKRDRLSFAASPWNAGPGPLVVEGFRRPGEDVMDAFQYFHEANGTAVGKAAVGTFEYDARRGHDHWHFLQFVRFSVVTASGREVVRSRKQAFCLAPTDAVDLTVPGAASLPHLASLGSMCGSPRSLWVRETLFAGWADTYFQSTPGQSFDVTNLPNGRYYVRVEVNPLGVLREGTVENNVADRLITLGGRPGNRRVTVAPWNGITQ